MSHESKRIPVVRTTRDMIRGVADRWKEQYGSTGNWRDIFGGNSKDIWKRLGQMDVETASPEDVEAIIGNGSWTSLKCDQCERNVDAVVELGEASDCDSRSADICFDCLQLASEIAKKSRPATSESRPSVIGGDDK